MSYYRTDPETGRRYMFGGLIGNRTIDDRRSDREAFDQLMERRAGELPRRRLNSRTREHMEWLLGGVKRAGDESVACPECQSAQPPWAEYCGNCGEPLQPVDPYPGAGPSATLKCVECGRYNDPANNNCQGCGKSLLAEKTESKSKSELWPKMRPRAVPEDRPVVFQRPAAHAGGGLRSHQMVVARETFDAVDPRTHYVVHVIAGRTRVGDGCWLHKLRPSAFEYA
jgi:uncharacterized OB-fold protein